MGGLGNNGFPGFEPWQGRIGRLQKPFMGSLPNSPNRKEHGMHVVCYLTADAELSSDRRQVHHDTILLQYK